MSATDDNGVLNTYSTDGRIVVDRSTALLLHEFLPLGGRVEIVGAPEPIPPTAVPVTAAAAQPTPASASSSTPCPVEGTPLDCYTVVASIIEYGDCRAGAIDFGDSCWSHQAGELQYGFRYRR